MTADRSDRDSAKWFSGLTEDGSLPYARAARNRAQRRNDAWPRRLVPCRPMRTPVEQTERAVSEWIGKAELDSRVKIRSSAGNQRLARSKSMSWLAGRGIGISGS